MNWSLVLNAVLLVLIPVILYRTFRKKPINPTHTKPSLALSEPACDDIIAVRKVSPDTEPVTDTVPSVKTLTQKNEAADDPIIISPRTLLLFLLAKPQRQLAGYEMLQTILAAGLRFGEGQLFHRHTQQNGQGPIICSLAAATATGTFDLQNIGAFSAKGLCLYMNTTGNPNADQTHLDKMIETAEYLAEGLDTFLLDDQRKPFTSDTKKRYRAQLETVS